MDQTPAAGWYDDPSGGSGLRYWDGQRWTDSAPPDPGGGVDLVGGARWRTPLVVGAAMIVVAVVAAAVLLVRGGGDGAPTPLAAAQALTDALTSDRWGDAVDLLAPDEVGVFEDLIDRWSTDWIDDLAASLGVSTRVSDQVRIEVVLGEPREIADGLQAVPIDEVTVTPLDGPFAQLLREDVGDGVTEDLRDDPTAVLIAVDRGGWFVSPIGTVLEAGLLAIGLPGAGDARPRDGADGAEAALDEMVQALTVGDLPAAVSLLDPDELRILDHYGRTLQVAAGFAGTAEAPSLQLQASSESTDTLRVEQALFDTGFGAVTLDLRDFCVREPGFEECLSADTLRGEIGVAAMDPAEALGAEAVLAALEPEPLPLRVGTTQRDGRHYLSLRGTIRATVVPLADRLAQPGSAFDDLGDSFVDAAFDDIGSSPEQLRQFLEDLSGGMLP